MKAKGVSLSPVPGSTEAMPAYDILVDGKHGKQTSAEAPGTLWLLGPWWERDCRPLVADGEFYLDLVVGDSLYTVEMALSFSGNQRLIEREGDLWRNLAEANHGDDHQRAHRVADRIIATHGVLLVPPYDFSDKRKLRIVMARHRLYALRGWISSSQLEDGESPGLSTGARWGSVPTEQDQLVVAIPRRALPRAAHRTVATNLGARRR